LEVDDRIEIGLEVKKLLTKKNFVLELTKKCHTLEVTFNMFSTRIEALNKKCLPSLIMINDKLMTMEDYMKKLQDIAKDIAKSSHIKGTMTRRECYQAISNMSFIQHGIKHIFIVKPTFALSGT